METRRIDIGVWQFEQRCDLELTPEERQRPTSMTATVSNPTIIAKKIKRRRP
jgi:hypothetical protein